MKKLLLLIVCTLLMTGIAAAQNSRLVRGVVQTEGGSPLKGATIRSNSDNVQTFSGEGGAFEIAVSPYTTHLDVKLEQYITTKVEIDGSYVVARLKVDKNYFAARAKAAAEAAKKAEAERLAKEKAIAAKAKAEEDARLEAAKRAEAERLAKERAIAAKAKAEEQARLDAAKRAEAERLAKERAAAAKAKAEAQARVEAAKKAEAERLAKERAAAAKAKAEEQARVAAAKKAAANKRRKMYAEVQKGFGSIVDVSYLQGLNYYPSFGATYTAGYRFNNQIYLGAGAGISFNMDGGKAVRRISKSYNNNNTYGEALNPSLISVPVFAYFKANFIDRRCSPFFALSVGGNLSAKQTLLLDLCQVEYNTMGAFVNPQLGVNFRTTKKTSIYLAAGFQCFTMPSCIQYTGYNAVLRSALGYGVDFHFGFTF